MKSFLTLSFQNLKNNKKGFTLIEVLVAVTIMAGVVTTVALAWNTNTLRIRKSQNFNIVSSLIEQKMTELEVEYEDKKLTEIPEELSGDFGSDYPKYRWTFTSQDFQIHPYCR